MDAGAAMVPHNCSSKAGEPGMCRLAAKPRPHRLLAPSPSTPAAECSHQLNFSATCWDVGPVLDDCVVLLATKRGDLPALLSCVILGRGLEEPAGLAELRSSVRIEDDDLR